MTNDTVPTNTRTPMLSSREFQRVAAELRVQADRAKALHATGRKIRRLQTEREVASNAGDASQALAIGAELERLDELEQGQIDATLAAAPTFRVQGLVEPFSVEIDLSSTAGAAKPEPALSIGDVRITESQLVEIVETWRRLRCATGVAAVFGSLPRD